MAQTIFGGSPDPGDVASAENKASTFADVTAAGCSSIGAGVSDIWSGFADQAKAKGDLLEQSNYLLAAQYADQEAQFTCEKQGPRCGRVLHHLPEGDAIPTALSFETAALWLGNRYRHEDHRQRLDEKDPRKSEGQSLGT